MKNGAKESYLNTLLRKGFIKLSTSTTEVISPGVIAAIATITSLVVITAVIVIVLCKRKKDKEREEKELLEKKLQSNDVAGNGPEKLGSEKIENPNDKDTPNNKDENVEMTNLENKGRTNTKSKKEIKFDDENVDMTGLTWFGVGGNKNDNSTGPMVPGGPLDEEGKRNSVLQAVKNENFANIVGEREAEYDAEHLNSKQSSDSTKSANKKMKQHNLADLMNFSFTGRNSFIEDTEENQSQSIHQNSEDNEKEMKENQSELRKITIKLKETITGKKVEPKEKEDNKQNSIIINQSSDKAKGNQL